MLGVANLHTPVPAGQTGAHRGLSPRGGARRRWQNAAPADGRVAAVAEKTGARRVTTHSVLAGRLPAIDLLKVLASQAIVWHHLVLYGPMARTARPVAEPWIDWLADHGRAAVYAFLVIAGYLAAGALLPRPGQPARIAGPAGGLQIVLRRYRRLAPPYLVAVGLAVAVAAFARWAMTDPDTPLAPGAGQLIAHALLLHDLLGYPALSAGVW